MTEEEIKVEEERITRIEAVAQKAVEWWRGQLGGNTKFDNGDLRQSIMMEIVDKMSPVNGNALDTFCDMLFDYIKGSLAIGEQSVNLYVDYSPVGELGEIARRAKLSKMFPCKTGMNIDDNKIKVSCGYRASDEIIYVYDQGLEDQRLEEKRKAKEEYNQMCIQEAKEVIQKHGAEKVINCTRVLNDISSLNYIRLALTDVYAGIRDCGIKKGVSRLTDYYSELDAISYDNLPSVDEALNRIKKIISQIENEANELIDLKANLENELGNEEIWQIGMMIPYIEEILGKCEDVEDKYLKRFIEALTDTTTM